VQLPEGVHEVSSATIRIRTTERGLPIAMTIAAQALSRPPSDLARSILAMCELSARHAQVARRRHLVASGFPSAVVDSLNLSTAEGASTDEHDDLPETWLRDV